MKPTSKFANQHQRRDLADRETPPVVKAVESREKPPPAPKGRSSKPKMTEVTVKLTDALLSKLDRLVKRESKGLSKAGRSTVLRWILDQFEE